MKPSAHILPLLGLLLTLLPGCTHNNGDIGPLFGRWKVESIESSDMELPPYGGNMFWSFQNTTVCMQTMGANHEEERVYGNWSLTDGTLLLSFPYDNYAPPAATLLPRESRLQVLHLDRRHATLYYQPSASTGITYTLRKW